MPWQYGLALGFKQSQSILHDTGLVGVSLYKDDDEVKCLHAHLADYLVRGDTNPIGPLAVAGLEGAPARSCVGVPWRLRIELPVKTCAS